MSLLASICCSQHSYDVPESPGRQTEGVTGSYQSCRRGETRGGAAQKETTKRSGKGNSKGPTCEQWGPATPKIKTSNSNPTARRCSTRTQLVLQTLDGVNGASNTTKQQGNQPPVKGAASLRRKATPKGSRAKTGSRRQLDSLYCSKDCPARRLAVKGQKAEAKAARQDMYMYSCTASDSQR